MGKTWSAYALLRPHDVIPPNLPLPFQLSKTVSIQAPPQRSEGRDNVDLLQGQVEEAIANDGIRHCIVVDYQASTDEELQSHLPGQAPGWSIHDMAEQKARLALLSLWLVRPTMLTFTTIVIFEQDGSSRTTRAINTYGPTYALENLGNDYSTEDLATASRAFTGLEGLSKKGPLRTASLITTKAVCDPTWEFRFLLMWLSMECLFGPEDPRETTFRLAQRVALFLESNPYEAKELFGKVKESYGLRSKIVHGFRLAKLGDAEFLRLLLEMETLLRRSLLTILTSDQTIANFDGRNREAYLDGLVFR